MRKPELNPKILEFLRKKLEGTIAETTIRPEISRIKASNPSLTPNAAAEIYARKHGTTVHRYLDRDDRVSYGTILREENVGSAGLPSSKAIYVRSARNIKTKQRVQLDVERALRVEANEKWDAFVCYASEDKDAVARPLHDVLTDAGVKVWFDESTLKLGDRLHKSIDKGILNSGFGIVILSKNFFKKDWPQRELEALVAKESSGKKIILPVWHNVDAAFIRSKSLLLAGLLGVSTNKGIENVAEKILEVIKPIDAAHPTISKEETRFDIKSEESVRGILERTISSLLAIDDQAVNQTIKDMEFKVLKQTYSDVLEAVAVLDVPCSPENKNVFAFIKEAILGRNTAESSELYEMLLDWYFNTATPRCKQCILEIIANLTRKHELREISVKENRPSLFIAEFGRSRSYNLAGVTAEILQNIKSSFTPNHCTRVIDFAAANDQIYASTRAQQYLYKWLSEFEDKVDQRKIQKLYGLLP